MVLSKLNQVIYELILPRMASSSQKITLCKKHLDKKVNIFLTCPSCGIKITNLLALNFFSQTNCYKLLIFSL